jgi:predicted ATPase with chaperone activity
MAVKELYLSARAYYKILKIARTIGNPSGCDQIQSEHIAEAIHYRSLDGPKTYQFQLVEIEAVKSSVYE